MSHEIAGTYGLAAMDALHVAAALQIQADELITTEKQTKPNQTKPNQTKPNQTKPNQCTESGKFRLFQSNVTAEGVTKSCLSY
ncbi:MAG: hypothetical protein O9326_03210 [Microcystis sp. LE19-338.1B]|nr:hypothetical protein [Microcystis sp. LE19-338.1B]MCZ8359428.1 hypothetical protein [Microcystis sp. LE19-388.1G]